MRAIVLDEASARRKRTPSSESGSRLFRKVELFLERAPENNEPVSSALSRAQTSLESFETPFGRRVARPSFLFGIFDPRLEPRLVGISISEV